MSEQSAPAGSGPLRVVVIGGGITGLAAAYTLVRRAEAEGRDLACKVVEASPTWGGKVQTERVDGLALERGPDSFLARKPWARDLCVSLGLGADLVGVNPLARSTYVLHHGRLETLPEGMAMGAPTRFDQLAATPLLSPWGKVRAALDLAIPRGPARGDLSLGAFLSRRVGREVAERLAEPLLAGIHAGDIWDLSLEATFPQFRDLEQRHGSLIAGLRHMRAQAGGGAGAGVAAGATTGPTGAVQPAATTRSIFLSLRSGLSSLVDALVTHLSSRAHLAGGERVVRIEPTMRSRGPFRVHLASGGAVTADAVICTMPAFAAAELVAPFCADAAQRLQQIPFATVAAAVLAYRTESVGRTLDGTGFLVPRDQSRTLTACTWVSAKWPHCTRGDDVVLRCYVGRAGEEDALRCPDGELLDRLQAELRPIMDLRGAPYLTRVYRWPRSMPQYRVGHLDRVNEAEALLASWPGLFLAGAGYRGSGLPDCIRQGREAAERAWTAATR